MHLSFKWTKYCDFSEFDKCWFVNKNLFNLKKIHLRNETSKIAEHTSVFY